MTRSLAGLCSLLLVAGRVFAFQPVEAPPYAESARPLAPFPATGTVQFAFPPHDRADLMIIEALDAAHTQILVQAYSFTHRRIADALMRAHRRGVDVRVIADHEQTVQLDPSVIHALARAGIPVQTDAQHSAAHNKIIVIDGAQVNCAVVTGSFNFTYAAQSRNAENALILRGNPPLCAAYQRNWNEHRVHSLPYYHR
jgi:phosphatidylserine/phosphatidylglycerophosphate/cardiolipin synthase-like enzyme